MLLGWFRPRRFGDLCGYGNPWYIAELTANWPLQFADRFLKHFWTGDHRRWSAAGSQQRRGARLALLDTEAGQRRRNVPWHFFIACTIRPRSLSSFFRGLLEFRNVGGASKLPRSPWRIQKSSIASDLAYSSWHAYRVPISELVALDGVDNRLSNQRDSNLGLERDDYRAGRGCFGCCRRKLWQPTLVLIPGFRWRWRSLVRAVGPLGNRRFFRGLLWGGMAGAGGAAVLLGARRRLADSRCITKHRAFSN